MNQEQRYGYRHREDPPPRTIPQPTSLTSGGSAAGKAGRQESRGVTAQLKEGVLKSVSEETITLNTDTGGIRFYDQFTRAAIGNQWETI